MKKICILSIATFAASSLQAQVTANSELKSFINQSFAFFPKIKEVANTVNSAEQKLTLTQINQSPEVTGDASFNYIRPKISIPINGTEFQFAPVYSMNAAVNASYTVFDFGRLKANIEKSKTDLQLAQHNVANVKAQLANQVATIYYNMIYLKKAIAIQDSVLLFLTDNKTLVENKLKNGDALKFDVVTIQATIDNTLNQKADLQNALQKQQNLLAYTTGNTQNNGTSFDFEVALADAAATLATAQGLNLDFVLAKDKIKQAQSDVALAKLGDQPIVAVHAGAGFKNGYVPTVETPRFNYIAGVALSVPIYNGGKTKQQVKLAETFVKQNELAVESLNNSYKKDIAQALVDVQTNLERIRNTEGQIAQAQYAQTLAETRFKNGVGTNLELTNASTNVQRALLTKLQYQYQLCLAKVELARLMGNVYW